MWLLIVTSTILQMFLNNLSLNLNSHMCLMVTILDIANLKACSLIYGEVDSGCHLGPDLPMVPTFALSPSSQPSLGSKNKHLITLLQKSHDISSSLVTDLLTLEACPFNVMFSVEHLGWDILLRSSC